MERLGRRTLVKMDRHESVYITDLEKELADFKEQYASLKSMFRMTTAHLKEVLDDLTISEKRLFDANKDLTDSINYAKRIQNAFTVQKHKLKDSFPNSFVFDKPKDTLSGDFVWTFENCDRTFLGVGDCTGHGVPGAMLSIFIVSMLNQIMSASADQTPASILDKLDKKIQEYLYQNVDKINDSAEISIIEYDPKNKILFYSAANRPLIHIRNGVLTTYRGSKCTLGDSFKRFSFVKNIEIPLEKGDMVFMFSDGYVDQFGGADDKKFLTKRLLALLQEIADLPVHDQHTIIESTFINWQGENLQIDDVLLLGFRV
ncbi:serine/threonine-protein phosphatase [Cryomorpha ignava]|uniref:Serine/threonine-protein phosphatase n=1 Tax=Cryomorpha ignava TaxID=101383 RepID=A0A7K3WUH9_9FLAO|nr:PP2C family protein-serine/threonine phosphatase [Cryomorpha ignava]NEN25198.1 serine/threonine-protein phosphatase [Cryomorpha ignava]